MGFETVIQHLKKASGISSQRKSGDWEGFASEMKAARIAMEEYIASRGEAERNNATKPVAQQPDMHRL